MKKILILVNGAHEHRPFYAGVGAELERRGHEVHYALDSHYTDFLHPDVPLGKNVHYFSDYFRDHVHHRKPPTELAGTNFNLMLFPEADRLMHTRSRAAREASYYDSLSANLAHFFVGLFDRYAFDSLVYENISNTMSFVAYAVAEKRGARFVGLLPSRLPGRTDVLDRAQARDSRLELTFYKIKSGALEVGTDIQNRVREYIGDFDRMLPDYMTHPHPFAAGLLDRYLHTRSIGRMLRTVRYFMSRPDDARYAHQIGNPFIAYPEQLANESARHLKIQLLRRGIYRTEVDTSRPYFIYPIQFHPESSTSVDGPAFGDEWSNIQGIAQNLPFGYSLYVKDHKHAAGRQSLAFYKRVGRLPNVILVSPDYDTKALIRHSKGVVCSTSTLGFEALILGKPVFVLGHPFYDFFPSCIRVDSFDGAHAKFQRNIDLETSRSDIEALVAAYFITSEDGRLDLLEMYADPSVQTWIADVVERKTIEERTPHTGANARLSHVS